MTNQLLGVEPRLGMAMFRSVSATADKLAILRTLASERLSKDLQGRLEDVIGRYSSQIGTRSHHPGHWFVSDDHPEALVWADPADELTGATAFWSGCRASADFEEQLKFARDFERPRPDCLLFEKADF